MVNDKVHDVAIAGGGMVGLTLGLTLAQGGLETIVFDALDAKTATDAKFDGRVSAIALASCRMLEALGIWERLAPHAQPINEILVTDGSLRTGATPFFLHFDHREIGDKPLGHIIENRHTRLALLDAARTAERLTLVAPAAALRAEPDAGKTWLILADARRVATRLAIAAEGRGSALRRAADIKLVEWPYDQSGIVTTVEHEHPHKGMAQEFFLPRGPFAILPMVGNRSSLVWTEKRSDAEALMTLSDAAFNQEIARRFGDHLGRIAPVGPRWSYPLGLQIARTYVAPRLVLVGDAAHGIHPIAGQGLNLGLRDVAALAEVLVEAGRLGLDIGDDAVIRKYERWRRFDNLTLALAMDALNRLFSNDLPPVRLARDLGISLVSRIGLARRVFMRHAGGVLGLTPESLPRLLKGEAL